MLLVTLNTFATEPQTQVHRRQVVLLCFPVDELIRSGCDTFKIQMERCNTEVIEMNDPTAAEVKTRLQALPTSVPVFISAHGHNYSKRHYLSSNTGSIWAKDLKDHEPVKIRVGARPDHEQGSLENFTVTETFPYLQATKGRMTTLSACFSGVNCGNSDVTQLIASCSYNENSKGDVQIGDLEQEPVLYWVAQLYCDEKLFNEVDGSKGDAKDQELSQKEIGAFLAGKMGGLKSVPFIFFPGEMPSNKDDDDALRKITRFIDESAVVRVISSLEGRIKEANAEKEKRINPTEGISAKVIPVGEQYALKLGTRPPVTMPGYYPDRRVAEHAAKTLLRHWVASQKILKLPLDTEYEVQSLGAVFALQVEDRTKPCRVIGYGLTQTPVIQTTPMRVHDR